MFGRQPDYDYDYDDDGRSAANVKLNAAAQRPLPMREWLAAHPEDRRGPKGTIRKSNRTDNESAKMATGKGVIQGSP